jgi:hypothetical protein
VIEPDVEPTTRATLIDPTTEPWAWKSLRETAALKLSTIDVGVGEGEGEGDGEGVGEGDGEGVGVGARVGSGKNGLALPKLLGVTAVPPHAATDATRTTITTHARRPMPRGEGRCLMAAFGMRASYAPAGPVRITSTGH